MNPYERQSDLRLICGADTWPLSSVQVGSRLIAEGNVRGVTLRFGVHDLEQCEYRRDAIKDSLYMEIKAGDTTIMLRPHMCDQRPPQVGRMRVPISFDSEIQPVQSPDLFPAYHYVTSAWEVETIQTCGAPNGQT